MRNNVIGRLQAWQSQTEVAQQFNVHQSTMSRLWQRWNQTGSAQHGPRSSRLRTITPVQYSYIRVFHLRHRTVTATITDTSIPGLRRIFTQAVRSSLRQRKIRPKDLILTQIQTCTYSLVSLRIWTLRNWRRIWFCDESRFPGIQKVDRFGGGCAMVWAAISYNHVANLVRVKWNLTAQCYKDDILQLHMLNVIDRQRWCFSKIMSSPIQQG